VALLLFHVAWPPVYDFPPARPFEGPLWYDPYEGETGDWLKSNFHAHSLAWGGWTYGSHEPQEVRRLYRERGYDVYAVSNYQSISLPGPGDGPAITAYEHGYGAGAQHQTVIGARRVSWYEFLLYQGARQKQSVIDRLADQADVVFLNHPNKQDSYSLRDMQRLTGYTAIEVATKYARAEAYWDAALSAGRPVWGVCADDGHKMDRASHIGIGWIMIDSASRAPETILEAIRKGRFYGVWTRKRDEPNALVSCRIREGRLEVQCEEPADLIRFIGQDGRVLDAMQGESSASYRLRPDDTYVRTEVVTGRTTLFLNPVFRHSGDPFDRPVASIRAVPTWTLRIGGATALLLAAGFLILGFPFRGFGRR
jgi:hypothetical protein